MKLIINPKIFVFMILGKLFLFNGCNKTPDNFNREKLNSIVDKYITDDYLPFLHIRIEDKYGKVIYQRTKINSTALPGEKINEKSPIRIWSMSKIVTISLIMDLVEDGIISLDDPVVKYIPEFSNLKVAKSPDGRSISVFTSGSSFEPPSDDRVELACPINLVDNDSIMKVRHLVDHKAGFYYANTQLECIDGPIIDENPVMASNSDSLINILSRLPLIHNPGERYHYGLNTTVLGLVAERATNLSLNKLLNKRINEPMKINGLKYKLEEGEKLIPPMTYKDGFYRTPKKGEMDILGRNTPNYNKDQEVYFGGSGMLATSDGYADYLRIWLNEGELNGYQFLDKKTIKKMVTSVRKESGYGIDTNFFFFITGDSVLVQGTGDIGLWEGGGYEGTSFWIDHKYGFVAVVMTQVWWPKDGAFKFRDEFRSELYQQLAQSKSVF